MLAAGSRSLRRSGVAAVALLVGVGCGIDGERPFADGPPSPERVPPVTAASTASTVAPALTATPPDTVEPATTSHPTTAPLTSLPPTSLPPAAPSPVTTSATAVTTYVVPVAPAELADWNPTHAAYPATDIFVAGGCGATVVSPADGVVVEVRTVDEWSAAQDDPATRGGRSVAIVGDDGVRYYLAHFATVFDDVVVGRRLGAGTLLGTVGDSGRASACHVHFGISPPCPQPEWSVRRGVVWPHPYLDAWQAGRSLSPAAEVEEWSAANPVACETAAQ